MKLNFVVGIKKKWKIFWCSLRKNEKFLWLKKKKKIFRHGTENHFQCLEFFFFFSKAKPNFYFCNYAATNNRFIEEIRFVLYTIGVFLSNFCIIKFQNKIHYDISIMWTKKITSTYMTMEKWIKSICWNSQKCSSMLL